MNDGLSIPINFSNGEMLSNSDRRAYSFISSICTSDEKIVYLALQRNSIFSLVLTGLSLTSRRLIYFQKSIFGAEVADINWVDLNRCSIQQQYWNSTIQVTSLRGVGLKVEKIPSRVATICIRLLKEKETWAENERRERILEEKRAGATGIVLSQNNDSVSRLKQLKELLDQGLISTTEYESKKKQILAGL